jgi:hypothetical protein
VAATLVAAPPPQAHAASPDIAISQVYGGGGNSGAVYSNDFVELFNRGDEPVSLAGWSVQYGSSGGTTWLNRVDLPDAVVPPGGAFLIQLAAGANTGLPALPTPDTTGTINASATNGKFALVTTTTALTGACPDDPAIRDFVGYGSANCAEGTAAQVLTNATAAVRRDGGCTDTDDNASDFERLAPAPRNSATPAAPCDGGGDPGDPGVVIDCGAALRFVETYGGSATVEASHATRLVTGIAVTDITPAPVAGTIAVTDLDPATAPGETATATVTAGTDLAAGSYQVTVTASTDGDEPLTASCTLTVEVVPLLAIGEIQGAVGEGDDGFTHRSPFAPAGGNGAGPVEVAARGVVTQLTLQRSAAGGDQNGLFLQDTLAGADGDPLTSDGIFVFIGGFDTLRADFPGFYTPQVGDEIVVRGRINEFFSLTQFSNPFVVDVVRSGVDLDAETPAFEIDPPDDLADAGRYWERREGMRARVLAGSLAVGGRDVFASTFDGEVWLIRGDHPVAQRDDPYARRVFRDAHPLDNDPAQSFDDGNGYRFMIGSLGVKATAGDNTELIAPARTFDAVTNSPAGGVYFSFGKFGVMVEENLALANGADPSQNGPPQSFDLGEEYSIAIYNVENLYDFRDDPNDGCDFAGNAGCPGVTPPFDYVPASQDEYEAQLTRLAEQIRVDLHAPDVLLVQETEDQDICAPDYTTLELACHFDGRDDVSGTPDSLTELALEIERQGGPRYTAVLDRDGADDRGIVSAFMFRSDRVELVPADTGDPVLGSEPAVDHDGEPLASNSDVSNPKALNAELPERVECGAAPLNCDGGNVFSRAVQVGLFRLWRDGIGTSTFTDAYLTSNHFSSGPDARVEQRSEQAAYNAAIATALLDADPGARVVVGGDLNVFPRPDDPFSPGHPLHPSDQLAALYDAGLDNLYEHLVAEAPSAAYSYGFQGQAQTLDHLFTGARLTGELVEVRSAKINVDWPAAHDGYGRFGVSDHDPGVARFAAGPTIDRLADLVRYFADLGEIDEHVLGKLLDRLERAQAFADAGKTAASAAQLQAFANQVLGFTPQFVSPVAGEALAAEATVLHDHAGG